MSISARFEVAFSRFLAPEGNIEQELPAFAHERDIMLRLYRALVLTRTEVTTYTVQVTHYFGGQSNFWAKIAAMSVLGTIPVFITVAVMQRYLVRGISMGAVKG